MNPTTAAKIVALRPALESMAVRATENPESVTEPSNTDTELMNVVRALSKPTAGKFGLSDSTSEG